MVTILYVWFTKKTPIIMYKYTLTSAQGSPTVPCVTRLPQVAMHPTGIYILKYSINNS